MYEADIHSFPDNPFDNKILNRETLHILGNGWNTAIHPDYLDLLEANLHLSISRHTRLSNHGHPFAYTVINDIYQTLQEKFLHTETLSESQLRLTSCGHYSRFLINRTINSDFPQSLPNINRRSWETAFYQLAWKPGGNLRRRIRRALHKTHTISGLATVLRQTVGSEYLHKVSDILYALETLGELQDYRGTLN